MQTTDNRRDVGLQVLRAWNRPAGPAAPLSPAAIFSDTFSAVMALPGHLFDLDELRASELDRLDEMTADAIIPIRDRLEQELLRAMADVVLVFRQEHPEAPVDRR